MEWRTEPGGRRGLRSEFVGGGLRACALVGDRRSAMGGLEGGRAQARQGVEFNYWKRVLSLCLGRTADAFAYWNRAVEYRDPRLATVLQDPSAARCDRTDAFADC